MPGKPYVIHVISNTHWDREWLYNFQETRMLLVEMMDALIDIMDTEPGYRSYLMDSQAVPVEDYLEVRPEMRPSILMHVANKRLLIGPWYTCPECFEVNGESLVRNLLYGHRVAREFGHVMKVGHTPFSYGQNSQMPQIYKGFGIDTMLFYHGVSHDEVKNEFVFEGADGTQVLGSQMSSGARYNFYHNVYRPVRYGKNIHDREYAWNEPGMQFHLCGSEYEMDHHRILDPKMGFNQELLRERVRALRESEINVSTTRHLAFMMGHDSSIADRAELRMIEEARQVLPGDEIKHGSYEDLLAAIKAEVKWDKLTVLKGERRTPKLMPVILHLYSDVLSSRTRMKQRNSRAEFLLQRQTEPFATAAAWLGGEYPQACLDLAWKTLLKCHAHDSISGSGVDAIEEDMHYRLRQVINISNGVLKDSLGALQLRIDNSDCEPDAVLLTVFNPAPYARSGVVSAAVDLPYAGPRGEFELSDMANGENVTVQGADRKPVWAVQKHLGDAASMMKAQRFHVHFEAKNIPGLGYASYKVDRGKMFQRGSLVSAANTLENEFLRVAIQPDGTLRVTHKKTGIVYSDLLYFLDNGEAGHAWMHHNPSFDQVIDSRGFPVSIALEEDGPLLARFRVECRMQVPARLDENGGDPWQRLDGVGNSAKRSSEVRELHIASLVTLCRGEKSVHVVVRFNNTAEDHRLRVLFPTRRPGTVCHAESAFDAVERETVFGEGSPWEGAQGVTFPMQRFVDVSGEGAGLAIINDGLREYEVTQDADRAIAVTLMRAYEINLATVSCRWETHAAMKLAQCPGEHAFSFLIYPHAGGYAEGGVFAEADRLTVPMIPAQSGAHGGDLPKRHGFLGIAPENLILSALKRADDGNGYILRVFNPTAEPVKGTITLAAPFASAQRVTLEELPEAEIPITQNTLHIDVAPKKIVTVRMT